MNEINLETIKAEITTAIEELLEVSKLEKGDIFVIGCSSSEIAGSKIGTFSSENIGKAVFSAAYSLLNNKGIYLACQCCEHLNRALIIEKECAKAYFLEEVNVVPQLKAGGSFATAAYSGFKKAVAVENIKAHAGIDIGDTLIGMHLKPVAVPVRITQNTVGNARVVCARTRARFIGGDRASYNYSLY